MFSLLFDLFPPSPPPPTTQHASDSASLQLQHVSLNANTALERQRQLEAENARLEKELTVVSRHPDKTPHPDTLSVSSLTLAHRRLSERLSETESILLERTTEWEEAKRKADNMVAYAEQCREALERGRRGEESAKERARALENMLRAAVEEKAMVERTVDDYADLVRGMERRSSASPVPSDERVLSPKNSFRRSSLSTTSSSQQDAGRVGLQRLLEEFNRTTEGLQQENGRLAAQLEDANLQLAVERRASEEDRAKVAFLKVELDQYMADDRSAGKMVSRYM